MKLLQLQFSFGAFDTEINHGILPQDWEDVMDRKTLLLLLFVASLVVSAVLISSCAPQRIKIGRMELSQEPVLLSCVEKPALSEGITLLYEHSAGAYNLADPCALRWYGTSIQRSVLIHAKQHGGIKPFLEWIAARLGEDKVLLCCGISHILAHGQVRIFLAFYTSPTKKELEAKR